MTATLALSAGAEKRTPLDELKAAIATVGLNLVGVASASDYDAKVAPDLRATALLPGAQSIAVIGNGGGLLWRAFVAELAHDHARLTGEQHPLDAFVRRAVMKADAVLGAEARRWFWAAADAQPHLDFRLLGVLAGLGAPSRLGLLLHARYGPWVGLRAACFLAKQIPASARSPSLCAGCEAPCLTACPGGAFPGGQWNVDRCTAFHRESDVCNASCAARNACPVGNEHRYPEEAIAYHYNRRSGRQQLRCLVGVARGSDPYEGQGPHWSDWRTRVAVRRRPR